MKLIINIPDWVYNAFKNNSSNCINIANIIANGIPLDNIRQEIRKLEWYGDDAFWDGVNAVSDIIDKHIEGSNNVKDSD